MARSRILWRLYGGFIVLVLLTVATIGVLISRTIERDSMEEIQNSLLARAQLLSGVITTLPDSCQTDPQHLQYCVQTLGKQIHTRLTVIAGDGTVLADSEEDPLQMDNHGSRPEVLEARSHGQGQATRFSRTLDTTMMYVATPLVDETGVIAYVRTALPLTTVKTRQGELRQIIFTGALVALLLSLPLGYLAARRITGPIESMTDLAREIARGEYDRRIRLDRKDEIGQLARAFNSMAEQSQQRIETIARDRNRLVTIFSGMVEGVVAVDNDEQVILMNVVAGDQLNVDPEESIGRPIREVTRATKIPDILSQALSRGEPVTAEIMIVGPRRDRIMEAYASPLSDFGQATTGAVVVLHDVSDLRRLESIRRDFVANVSHELKTPITAAQGLVETMLADHEMEPETRHGFLERVRSQISRLATLVGDLLTLSRLESGVSTRPDQATDFRTPIREKIAEFDPAVSNKEIGLKVNLPDKPILILAAQNALGQIVGNLIDNAIKYTEPKGEISLNSSEDDSFGVLEVTDTGIGIDQMHQERIFERFYRVDKARSRELGGTGLGLAIVKHLVRSHGGNITVKSVLGEGSIFRVELPLAPQKAKRESN